MCHEVFRTNVFRFSNTHNTVYMDKYISLFMHSNVALLNSYENLAKFMFYLISWDRAQALIENV